MSQTQLWSDAPADGAYQEQDVSQVVETAYAKTLFAPFAKKYVLGKMNGSSTTLPVFSQLALPTSDQLDEQLPIPLDKLSVSAKTISIVERGRGLQISKKALTRTPFDLEAEHRKHLSSQLQRVMDRMVAEAYKAAKVKFVADGLASATITTNGTAGAAATHNVNSYHMERIYDYMYDTLECPTFEDGSYVAIVQGKAYNSLFNDPKFIRAKEYAHSNDLLRYEVGMINGIRIIRSNHKDALSNSLGSGSDVGELVVFGPDATALVVAEEFGLIRAESDDKRFINIMFYGDMNAGTMVDTANAGEARIVHVTST